MSVITVGDFDGVHLGHRRLIRRTARLAASLNTTSAVLTFDRNCKGYLRGTTPVVLTLPEERKKLLLEEVDDVYQITFDETFSKMSAIAFLRYLRDTYQCTDLVGGEDFSFGRKGQGTLTDGLVVEGIRQHVVPLKTDLIKISSSSVRAALSDGLIERANAWLGYVYSLSGVIVEGQHLGRTIGFPTVNIFADPQKALPKNGVYVTETEIDGMVYRSLTNIGVRPTVSSSGVANVETHLFDADGDFYGRTATVRFLSRLRDEMKFPNVGALMQQLRRDRERAFLWHDSSGIFPTEK